MIDFSLWSSLLIPVIVVGLILFNAFRTLPNGFHGKSTLWAT